MFKLLALSALTLSLFSCASHPVSAEHTRALASERMDCRAVMCSQALPKCEADEKAVRDGESCCSWKCVPKAAPDCAHVKCMKKHVTCMRGEKRVDMRKPGACCPDFKCVSQFDDKCLHASCPAVEPPNCEPGQQLMDLRDKGECCLSWSCEDEGDRDEDL